MNRMIQRPTRQQMMEAHVHLNLGVYFDNVTRRDNVVLATSQQIADCYWNYAFIEDGGPYDRGTLAAAVDGLAEQGRRPAILQLFEQSGPQDWEVASEEPWMGLACVGWAVGA